MVFPYKKYGFVPFLSHSKKKAIILMTQILTAPFFTTVRVNAVAPFQSDDFGPLHLHSVPVAQVTEIS